MDVFVAYYHVLKCDYISQMERNIFSVSLVHFVLFCVEQCLGFFFFLRYEIMLSEENIFTLHNVSGDTSFAHKPLTSTCSFITPEKETSQQTPLLPYQKWPRQSCINPYSTASEAGSRSWLNKLFFLIIFMMLVKILNLLYQLPCICLGQLLNQHLIVCCFSPINFQPFNSYFCRLAREG